MSMDVCKIFLKVDILFDDGKPNLAKINKQIGKSMRDCPYDNALAGYKCKTDLEGIKALCTHLITELYKISKDKQKRENNNYQYIEYVMIWLGYRLFQSQSYSSPTLIDFYNNHLIKSYRNYDYGNLIVKKKHLKDADLYYMSRFYQLVQQICYITLVHSKNPSNVQGIKTDSTKFYNMYTSLYNDINECDSYLNLLNNLKTQYENLKKSLINNNRGSRRFFKGAIITNFRDLPPTKKKKKTTTIGFDCETCKKVNSNAKKKPSKPAPKPSTPSPSEPVPPATQLKLQPQPPSVSVPAPVPPENPKTPASPSSESSQQEKQEPPLPPPEQPPASIETTQKGSPDSQDVPNAAGDQLSNQENTPKGSDNDQHNSASKTKEQGDGAVDKPKQSQDAQQEISIPKHGNSSSGPENSDSLGNSDPKLPTNELKKQSSQSDSTHQPEKKEPSQQAQLPTQPESKNGTESKNTQAEGSSHPSGQDNSKTESKGLESSKPNTGDATDDTGSSRTGSEHLDGGSSDQGSGNSTEDKNSPQIDQTNQSQALGTNKEGSNGEQGNTNNDPLKGGGEQGGQDDQKSQDGSGDSGTEPGSEKNSKDSAPGEKESQNTPGESQVVKPKQFGNEIKGNETTGIGDNLLKKYKTIGISIIVLLIPITLAIMYKYLSSGWRKELKKKTNMKKVINSIGGKKQIQIIIKSSNQKKNTKKSINSVYGGKSPLLNVYKLMQADPVPFINLFFLLIFFVYKRKPNYLEL
ncbi:hypothetical protein YYE_04927 [Plasmodium vinckei vinckei]|uniref:CIR protein PIR protein n=1 Tax=Plasmodium vinckei vinckei TaxID=54757 RepID=A0A081I961_PLAVN|nr:hypothetical protein YYE_04927 [Plasmodium vinckei vinckei]